MSTLPVFWNSLFCPLAVVEAQVIMTPTSTTNRETGFIILCCNVSGINNLNSSTITYQWQKDNSTVSTQDEQTLSLSPLRASHAGRYTCQATVNSTSLSSPITVNSNSQIVNIQRKYYFHSESLHGWFNFSHPYLQSQLPLLWISAIVWSVLELILLWPALWC